MFTPRLLEEKLLRLSRSFKAVLVVGARQVGKSTLLSHCFPSLKHITFDALGDEYGAKEDPVRFLSNFPAPIILDEIQYRPELLAPLKRFVDRSDTNGQYLLTGSQNLNVLKGAAESMAGRVAIMQLDPLTIEELARAPQHFLENYLEAPDKLVERFTGLLPLKRTLFEMMWRGGLPGILELNNDEVGDYFSSYITTYIERDVRLLGNVQNITDFERFVRLCAHLTAQEINYSHLGRDIGITRHTASHWLETLKHTYQWKEIMPYYGNAIKRLSKKPKGYINDTGIACHLARISSPEALSSNPALGNIFENYISGNIFKLASILSTPPNIYHWRTNAGAEVDLVLERDAKLYPIEIKCKSRVTKRDTSGIKAFQETYSTQKIMPGLLIYLGEECYKIDENVIAVPWNAMFKPQQV